MCPNCGHKIASKNDMRLARAEARKLEAKLKLLAFIEANPGILASHLSVRVGISNSWCHQLLAEMEQKGAVERRPSGARYRFTRRQVFVTMQGREALGR